MGFFDKAGTGGAQAHGGTTSRHSSAWVALQNYLRSEDSLRMLDIGPTSAGNINFVTSLGHGIYMANLAEEAAKDEYWSTDDTGARSFESQLFLRQNLDFADRRFDVVAMWDVADFLPEPALQAIIDRLYDVMQPGGQLLAFFHSKPGGEEATFTRYHLTDGDTVSVHRVGGLRLLHTYTNRQVEVMFGKFSGWKFFLAKDALREVIVTR